MNYWISFDSVSGVVHGVSASTGNPPATISLTQAQYDAPPYGHPELYYAMDMTTSPPSLVLNPAYDSLMFPTVQGMQRNIIRNAFNATLEAPIAITMSSGMVESFVQAMGAFGNYFWEFVEKAYQSFVMNSMPLPSPFGLANDAGIFVDFALSDITALYKAMNPIVSYAFATFTKALSDINAATTINSIKAIDWGNP